MEFAFSEKNEEFIRLMNLIGKGIVDKHPELINEAKTEFAKYKISVGFKEETQQIVLIAEEAGNPCYFNLSDYDGIKDAEIVEE